MPRASRTTTSATPPRTATGPATSSGSCGGTTRTREAGISGLGTRDSGLGTRDSGLGTRDSGLGTRDSGLGTAG
ncbi:hypothetical protein F0H33_08465 [Xanthomonas translucens pv. undulosa]|nr:hypothetical protein F0H33_08465 [Xanthomonas translucens pv. undulosa]